MAHLNGAGAEKNCIDVLRNFDPERYEITLLLIYRVGVFLERVPGNVRIISIYDHIPGRWHEKLYKRIPALRKNGIHRNLKAAICDDRFDTIISFCEGLPVIAHSFITDHARLNLSWVHCDMQKYPWTRRFFRNIQEEKNAYSRMDRIICVSAEAGAAFDNKYGLVEKTLVIPNLIDRNLIIRKSEEKEVRKNKFTLINIGRLVPVKNQARLIEMMSILRSRGRDAELWILGDGPLRCSLERMARDHGVADCVRFCGFQSNPYPWLRQADLYVMSSDAEGYSLTISEALCLGVPVVTTPAVRTEELKNSGAVEIADFSSSSLATMVESLMIDQKKRTECARNAREYSKRFQASEVMDEIYSCMTTAIPNHTDS